MAAGESADTTAAPCWAPAARAASPASAAAAKAHLTLDARQPLSLSRPHHDGSALYVPEHPAEPGDRATVRLRVPGAPGGESVHLRYVEDGEARFASAEVDARSEVESWWRATFPVWGRPSRYRWLLIGGRFGYAWLNGRGLVGHDVPDADDFVIGPGGGGAEWHHSAVVYEIFPDRFARSGLGSDPPAWALPRAWGQQPAAGGPEAGRQWFGGDLRGVERHLDHIARLGPTALFLRPVFAANSSHRYDATSFDRVDPVLGGEEAFASLLRAAHARGMRVIGDLTANHTGDAHDWFLAARADPAAAERDFYYFDPALPDGYETWWDVATLPKLNWGSALLRERMAGVVRDWVLRGLDGWRIDAANMTGRRRERDHHRDAARRLRAAAGDAVLIAEHCHDARADLAGQGWHGATNYAGFLRPVWQWLRADQLPAELSQGSQGTPIGLPRLGAHGMEATMRAFRAGIPWSAVLHSWSLLDSCDSARFATVAGSRARHLVGAGLQMTLPGVPMVSAGDEIGLPGVSGEDSRRTMPWSDRSRWDTALEDGYRRLIALRRASPALQSGGLRIAHVDADCIAFLRELPGERVLALASRAEHPSVRIPVALLGTAALDTLHGDEAAVVGPNAVLPAEGPCFHAWRLGA